jgi:hypothetical protein
MKFLKVTTLIVLTVTDVFALYANIKGYFPQPEAKICKPRNLQSQWSDQS